MGALPHRPSDRAPTPLLKITKTRRKLPPLDITVSNYHIPIMASGRLMVGRTSWLLTPRAGEFTRATRCFEAQSRRHHMARSNAFGGDFQWWSRYLASWGLQELMHWQSRTKPFITEFEGVPCVIVPTVSNYLIELTVFYAPTRALSAARIIKTPVNELAANWRRYCRAFVSVELDPRSVPSLIPVDFNATRNARNQIQGAGPQWCPDFELLDEMLGTSLAGCSPDPLDDGPTILAKTFGWHPDGSRAAATNERSTHDG